MPNWLSAPITSVPALRNVPPLYVFDPLKINVPLLPLMVNDNWLPLSVMLPPMASVPLPVTARLSARTTGALMT